MLLVISALVLQAGQKAFSKGWALLDAWNYLQGHDSGRGNVGIGLLVSSRNRDNYRKTQNPPLNGNQ